MAPVDPHQLSRQIRRLYPHREIRETVGTPYTTGIDFARYRHDPIGFAYEVLGIVLTPDQKKILLAILIAPGRIKVESGHNVGKSFLMAVILIWWFYTRDPGVVICNAPKLQSSTDVLWTEVRLLIARARVRLPDYFVGPKAPELYHTPDHWAKAYTTSKGESYQGRHRDNMLFLFDEDEGIEPIYWQATSTMFQPDKGHAWVACCNPLTTASQSYVESELTDLDGKTPKWKLFTISSLDHPNIVAYREGRDPPFPSAVSAGQVNTWVKDWTRTVSGGQQLAADIEWPPHSGIYRRPGPTFKSRVLGIRPTEGVDTVWSGEAWKAACTPRWDERECWEQNYGITISLDASGYGDDDAAIHVRTGPLSLHHESHNGREPGEMAGILKQKCEEWCEWYNSIAFTNRPRITPFDIKVVMEFDGGYGIAVHSHRGRYHNWKGVTVGSASHKFTPDNRPQYKNVRAELWCEAAAKAMRGQMDLSRLPPETLDKLRLQLLTPYFEVLPDGSKLVEPKKDVKERLGRSPDDADALIIAHYDPPDSWPTVVMKA